MPATLDAVRAKSRPRLDPNSISLSFGKVDEIFACEGEPDGDVEGDKVEGEVDGIVEGLDDEGFAVGGIVGAMVGKPLGGTVVARVGTPVEYAVAARVGIMVGFAAFMRIGISGYPDAPIVGTLEFIMLCTFSKFADGEVCNEGIGEGCNAWAWRPPVLKLPRRIPFEFTTVATEFCGRPR